jgi:hypothetical protein
MSPVHFTVVTKAGEYNAIASNCRASYAPIRNFRESVPAALRRQSPSFAPSDCRAVKMRRPKTAPNFGLARNLLWRDFGLVTILPGKIVARPCNLGKIALRLGYTQ